MAGFAVTLEAIHAVALSYWHALGLGLFVYLVRGWHDNDFEQMKHWKLALVLLKASVPLEKERSTAEAIEEFENEWPTQLWVESLKAGTGFVVLVIGWGIHTFLM